MLRVTRGWLFVAFMALSLARAALGDPGFTNMLWNPSFEIGTGTPDGWTGFGFGERGWDFRGRDGSRCISITAAGRNAGWWYASRRPEIERNVLYRLSFWARSPGARPAAKVTVGLNICDQQIEVGPEWRRYEMFFRSPLFLPDAKVCFGQEALDGVVLFDDVALEPAVGLYRSTGGGGGISLGEGEAIVEGRYSAVHNLAGGSDRRFLDSYTGEYHSCRWVLDAMDEVVYRHTVNRLGIGLIDNTLVVSDRVRYLTGSMGFNTVAPTPWVEIDPRAERGLLQQPLRVRLDAPRVDGVLTVDVCQDGRSWLTAAVMTEPGVIDVELPPVIGRAYDVWVRIKSLDDRPCEVTGYRYEAFVEGDNRTTAEGASHYVAVLFAPPDLGLGIDDVGELSPDGRREVKLVVQNGRERLHLGCRVMVERGDGGSASSEEHSEWMDPGSKRRLYLAYDVEGTGPYVLRILGRDISSGRLLFSLAVPTPDGRASAGERLPEESAQAGAAPE